MAKTVIDLDDTLVKRARKVTRLSKTDDVVNHALAELVRHHEQLRLLELRGKIKWRGDLDAMRSLRS